MASIVTEFRRAQDGAGSCKEEIVFTKELIDDFFTMMHFWPIHSHKNSNNSKHMGKVLNLDEKTTPSNILSPKSDRNAAFIEQMRQIEKDTIYALMDQLG
jgi:hypothetical protein